MASTVRNVRPVDAVPANVVCLVRPVVLVSTVVRDRMAILETLDLLEIPSRCVPNTCVSSLSSVLVYRHQAPMDSLVVPAVLVLLVTTEILAAMEMLAHADPVARKDPPATQETPETQDKEVHQVHWWAKLPATLANPATPVILVDPEAPVSPEHQARMATTAPPATKEILDFLVNLATPVVPATPAFLVILDAGEAAISALLLVWLLDIKFT